MLLYVSSLRQEITLFVTAVAPRDSQRASSTAFNELASKRNSTHQIPLRADGKILGRLSQACKEKILKGEFLIVIDSRVIHARRFYLG